MNILNVEAIAIGGISLIGIIGVLGFFVSLIVQLTKGFIPKKIPTDLFVMVISLIVTMFALVMFIQWKDIAAEWYYYVLGIFGSFVVAFLAMNGWSKLKELWSRFVNKTEGE